MSLAPTAPLSTALSTESAALAEPSLRGWTLSGGRRRQLRLIGPAFVAAVAFIDPGNVATNVSAGSRYGYLLLWAVLSASAVATLVQYLSAKLAAATGASLAAVCRDNTPTAVRLGLWLLAESVVIMTDLAEFVGGAIALQLLFGVSALSGGLIIGAATMVVMAMRLRGRDAFPAVVVGLLFTITVAFAYLVVRSRFDVGGAASGLLPRFDGGDSALLACGIVGATVMPHAIFMHSSLMSGLGHGVPALHTTSMLRFLRRDVIIAMGLAGLVNSLILLIATGLPSGSGDSLTSVHAAFGQTYGSAFALIFALALLASGLASACAGLYSGQAIMRDFLHRNSSIWLRRLVSAVPALLILWLVNDTTRALVLSQVSLSFGLPFALAPLLIFTARRRLMGSFVNRAVTTCACGIATVVVIALNVFVLTRTLGG
ncbi:MAG TPA: Nramp family divalent metal transporter [Jatrophihabitans sp.]|nr:Nramp family divalent metal transporter [Jatrophihabitans sp.]